ncbi:predicted protein [Nematostella vectensis]|uniref:Uncharacterized protein n=1 Tax=Nematostella vectensis TaxID=45351 RepID=A7RFI3_NEMVE|nr:predicted protein [Nematostella vectensis]|eukprot:XP_001641669.1 predicted protein [Nematostella vectensis]
MAVAAFGSHLSFNNKKALEWGAESLSSTPCVKTVNQRVEQPLLRMERKPSYFLRNFKRFGVGFGCILFLLGFVSLTLSLGIRQHLNGPGLVWPTTSIKIHRNHTEYISAKVRLPWATNHHNWQYNLMIVRVWVGTCIILGTAIALSILYSITFCLYEKWRNRQEALCRDQKGRSTPPKHAFNLSFYHLNKIGASDLLPV